MTKQRIILIGIICGLSLIYILQLALGARSPQKRFKTNDDIDFISVENAGTTITAEKRDNDWYVYDEKADTTKVEHLINAASDIKTLSVAARGQSADTNERYGFDNAIVVRTKSGDKNVRTLFIGKESISDSQVYIRIDDKKEIYLAQGNMRLDFTFAPSNLFEEQFIEEEGNAEVIELTH